MFWLLWNKVACEAMANLLITPDEGEPAALREASSAPPRLPAQEKYELLATYGKQALCVLHPVRGCTYLSPNWPQMTGHEEEACIGQEFFRHLHRDYYARITELFLADAEKVGQRVKCQLMHGDKKWYWYELTVAEVRDDGEGGVELACVLHNIHEDHQAQNVLQKARLEAELALRSRSDFLANMSHDLRTPLNAVIGFAQIMESEIFGAIGNTQYLDYVRHIRESGYELLSKIDDLLQISRIDAGEAVLTLERIDLAELVQYVTEVHSYRAFAAQVTVHSTVEEGTFFLLADRLKLQQILGHLVSNAIRYNRSGGQVTITATPGRAGGVVVTVADTGQGMPPERHQKITEALARDNSWSVRDVEGLGVGLALAKEFAALHGGRLTLDSSRGAGTIVRVELPAACVLKQEPQEIEPARAAASEMAG